MVQAIQSDSFQTIEEAKEPIAKIEITEEKQIGDLSYSEGWRLLKEYIESLKLDLDEAWKSALAKGSDYEEIGKRTVITQLTKEYLNKVIEKVDDARNAVSPNQ